MAEPLLFDSRHDVLRYFARKYPLGTALTVIAAGEPCQREGDTLVLTLPAPNHLASRHFIRSDGRPGSMGVLQQWWIQFCFDDKLALRAVEAELVSCRAI